MRRTTHARSARDARRPVRAIHVRAASVIALAALGVGVAPAVAAPLTGTHSAIVTADKSGSGDPVDDASDNGGGDEQQPSSDPTEEATTSPSPSPSDIAQESSDSNGQTHSATPTDPQESTTDSGDHSSPPTPTQTGSPSDNGGDESEGTDDGSSEPRALKLNRRQVPAGQGIKVSVTGFTPGDDAKAAVTRPGETKPWTTKSIPYDKGYVWITIPPDAKTGTYTVNIASKSGSAGPATFKVTKPEKHVGPSLAITPRDLTAGDEIDVSGKGFWTQGTPSVQVTKKGSSTPIKVSPDVGEISRGKFTATATIPVTVKTGDYTVTATAGSGKRVKKATATVHVTSAGNGGSSSPTPTTPTTDTPTSHSPSDSNSSSGSNTPPSSSSSSDALSTSSASSSTSDRTHSTSTTAQVPPATSTRDRSKEIELSAPSDESTTNRKSEQASTKEMSATPTKDEDSKKAKDGDSEQAKDEDKASKTPEEASDQPVSQKKSDATEAAATMEDNDTTTSGPSTVTTEDDGGGPLVKLFSSIGGEDASGMDRIRQVFIATLGVAFLTALGFTTASWLGRRSGTHSARAGLRQLFHRKH